MFGRSDISILGGIVLLMSYVERRYINLVLHISGMASSSAKVSDNLNAVADPGVSRFTRIGGIAPESRANCPSSCAVAGRWCTTELCL